MVSFSAFVKTRTHKARTSYKTKAALQSGLYWVSRRNQGDHPKTSDATSVFLMDTPHNSPRNSPRSSPRGSPRNSPRSSPRGSPRNSPRSSPRGRPRGSPRSDIQISYTKGVSRFFLRRNLHKAKVAYKKERNEAKTLQKTRTLISRLNGTAMPIKGAIYTGLYDESHTPFGSNIPQQVYSDRETSLKFDDVATRTIKVGDIIEVHVRSDANTACSASGGARFRFQGNADERNIMRVLDSAGQIVHLDASLLVIYRT